MYTKGPWKYNTKTTKSCKDCDISGGKISNVFSTAPGWQKEICTLYIDDNHDADVRLIAASPDMYEALKYLADENNYNVDEETGYVEMKRPGGGYQEGIVLVSHNLKPWILAKQAIAKAEGK